MNSKRFVGVLLFAMMIMMACSSGADSSQVEATKMAIGIQQTQNAFIRETITAATQKPIGAIVEPLEAVDDAATQQAVEVENQAAQEAQQESTVEPVIEASATVEDAVQFETIADVVRADDADYYTMDDIDQTWNEKYTFWEKLSGQEAGNYVLSATIYWTAPVDMGEPARNGCGFIYGMSDPKHFHVTVISPDQKVHTYRKRSAEEIEMKGGDVPGGGLGVSSGQADLMVVVEDKTMSAYVNGSKVVMFNDPYIDYGQMGLAIDAATYSGFTCSFKDVEVWVLK
ncbi:MAG: hypothetical protein JEZ00_18520 [Anaerolineaceae bacterium]|nr:hypothetical protein [Anaerolineaceae bacterium]